MDIIIAPDDRLKLCSSQVSDFGPKLKSFASSMLETMYKNRGMGLAAVQVGVHIRMFVMHIEKHDDQEESMLDPEKLELGYQDACEPMFIINPVITRFSREEVLMREGCLSVPQQYVKINRPQFIELQYQDCDGNEHSLKAQSWLSRCIQHEFDHLNGVLLLDKLSKLKQDMALVKAKKIKRNLASQPRKI